MSLYLFPARISRFLMLNRAVNSLSLALGRVTLTLWYNVSRFMPIACNRNCLQFPQKQFPSWFSIIIYKFRMMAAEVLMLTTINLADTRSLWNRWRQILCSSAKVYLTSVSARSGYTTLFLKEAISWKRSKNTKNHAFEMLFFPNRSKFCGDFEYDTVINFRWTTSPVSGRQYMRNERAFISQ